MSTNKKFIIIFFGILLFIEHYFFINFVLKNIIEPENFETARLLSWVIHSGIIYPLIIYFSTKE